jgi:hypothetical protein
MSTSHIKPAGRKAPRNRVVATHKYSVGASVLYSVSERAGKTSFAITRQMPDGGGGFQYRIKCDRDGQERVVAEATLGAVLVRTRHSTALAMGNESS